MISITTAIIAITVLVSLICFNDRNTFNALSLNPYNIVHRGQWWRTITHGLVHADYIHLIINMFVFWSFGSSIENQLLMLQNEGIIPNATAAFLTLYIGGIIFSSVPDIFKYRNNPYYSSIGASGAVSAVLFTSIFFSPWSKVLLFAIVPIPAILFGVCYLWYSQYMSSRGGNINHGAHFWGAVFGFVFPIIIEPRLWTLFWNQLIVPHIF